MDPISERKLHFAPYKRQTKALERILRQRRFRNVTEFMRAAIDHYLDHLGHPPLAEQARQMAEDFHQNTRTTGGDDSSSLQNPSMASDERW